jgi:flagellar biosynthetic protein FliR
MSAGGAILPWIAGCLLVSMRLAPALLFAPPFSLTRTPPLFRVLFAVGLGAVLAGHADLSRVFPLTPARLLEAGAFEAVRGLIVVLALQLAFAAIHFGGRMVDIQAGFGLAAVVDPTTGSQSPLIGTVLTYGVGAVFFALDGHADLLRIIAASLRAFPLGSETPLSLPPLLEFTSGAFLLGLGLVGGPALGLLLVDLAITLVSRTAPQMNVLILGLQVKPLVLVLMLSGSVGLSTAALVRLLALTFDALGRML